MKVRPATREDLCRVVELGTLMMAESPVYRKLKPSSERMLATFGSLLGNPDAFSRVVCDAEETIVGGMVALCVPHFGSDDKLACDVAFFIRPEARGTLAAARLIRAYLQWAREKGAVVIQVGITTGVHVEQTAALVERLGMQRCGVVLEVPQ